MAVRPPSYFGYREMMAQYCFDAQFCRCYTVILLQYRGCSNMAGSAIVFALNSRKILNLEYLLSPSSEARQYVCGKCGFVLGSLIFWKTRMKHHQSPNPNPDCLWDTYWSQASAIPKRNPIDVNWNGNYVWKPRELALMRVQKSMTPWNIYLESQVVQDLDCAPGLRL